MWVWRLPYGLLLWRLAFFDSSGCGSVGSFLVSGIYWVDVETAEIRVHAISERLFRHFGFMWGNCCEAFQKNGTLADGFLRWRHESLSGAVSG